ncbi:MAG: restriction endonuclease subunit S [Bryobacteraceae bacterium]|jgi:type I restriction enzyme S subunit
MEVRLGYKLSEAGVVPNDWEVKQIQEVCGFIVPGRNKPRVFDGCIPWITTPDLKDGGTVRESRSHLKVSLAEAKAVGSKVVPAGSVLMSCVGELGIVALAGCDMVINQQLHAFLPSTAVSAAFLLQALKTQKVYINSVATKTALPYLNKENCNSIPIPVPTMAEQKAIAGALSDVDALIDSLEQLIAKKRDIRQGAMQELLRPKRVWKEKAMGDLLTILHGRSQRGVASSNGRYPILASGGQIGTANRFLYDKPSVLIGRKGTIDQPQYMDKPFWAVDTLFYSAVREPNIPKYMFYQFCLIDWRRHNEASGVPSLNARTIERIQLRTPGPEEQTAIAAVLSDMDAEIAALGARPSIH